LSIDRERCGWSNELSGVHNGGVEDKLSGHIASSQPKKHQHYGTKRLHHVGILFLFRRKFTVAAPRAEQQSAAADHHPEEAQALVER